MDCKTSILEMVRDQTRDLEKKLGKDDRATVDQYLTAIRDVEDRIKVDREWLNVPPPKVQSPDFGKTPTLGRT